MDVAHTMPNKQQTFMKKDDYPCLQSSIMKPPAKSRNRSTMQLNRDRIPDPALLSFPSSFLSFEEAFSKEKEKGEDGGRFEAKGFRQSSLLVYGQIRGMHVGMILLGKIRPYCFTRS
eukprot:scaffold333_cov133-Cylindrotheca_fusiformis.AAC.57